MMKWVRGEREVLYFPSELALKQQTQASPLAAANQTRARFIIHNSLYSTPPCTRYVCSREVDCRYMHPGTGTVR